MSFVRIYFIVESPGARARAHGGYSFHFRLVFRKKIEKYIYKKRKRKKKEKQKKKVEEEESGFLFKDRMRVLEWARGPLLDPALMLGDAGPRRLHPTDTAPVSGLGGRIMGGCPLSSKWSLPTTVAYNL